VRGRHFPRGTWLSTKGDLKDASFLNYAKQSDPSWTAARMEAVLKCFGRKIKCIKDGEGSVLCSLVKAGSTGVGRKVTGDDGNIICERHHWWCLEHAPVKEDGHSVMGVADQHKSLFGLESDPGRLAQQYGHGAYSDSSRRRTREQRDHNASGAGGGSIAGERRNKRPRADLPEGATQCLTATAATRPASKRAASAAMPASKRAASAAMPASAGPCGANNKRQRTRPGGCRTEEATPATVFTSPPALNELRHAYATAKKAARNAHERCVAELFQSSILWVFQPNTHSSKAISEICVLAFQHGNNRKGRCPWTPCLDEMLKVLKLESDTRRSWKWFLYWTKL
jgi:hypothetical protein